MILVDEIGQKMNIKIANSTLFFNHKFKYSSKKCKI